MRFSGSNGRFDGPSPFGSFETARKRVSTFERANPTGNECFGPRPDDSRRIFERAETFPGGERGNMPTRAASCPVNPPPVLFDRAGSAPFGARPRPTCYWPRRGCTTWSRRSGPPDSGFVRTKLRPVFRCALRNTTGPCPGPSWRRRRQTLRSDPVRLGSRGYIGNQPLSVVCRETWRSAETGVESWKIETLKLKPFGSPTDVRTLVTRSHVLAGLPRHLPAYGGACSGDELSTCVLCGRGAVARRDSIVNYYCVGTVRLLPTAASALGLILQ